MKKYLLIFASAILLFVLSNCSASKKASGKKIPKTTYATDLSVVIMNNCVPCHIPAKGGRKKSYDNYANVKSDIDSMIRRITLKPTDKGFMPFKKTQQLSDSVIMVFKKWKEDGLLEK